MAAGKHREIHDVQQSKDMVPLITRETLDGQDVSELVFGVTYWIWIFGSKLILSNNQSRATLWVLDTCLRVGLRLLMITLITASSSSMMYI